MHEVSPANQFSFSDYFWTSCHLTSCYISVFKKYHPFRRLQYVFESGWTHTWRLWAPDYSNGVKFAMAGSTVSRGVSQFPEHPARSVRLLQAQIPRALKFCIRVIFSSVLKFPEHQSNNVPGYTVLLLQFFVCLYVQKIWYSYCFDVSWCECCWCSKFVRRNTSKTRVANGMNY